MKLTKEDFMRLPKERLAELLAEAQDAPPRIEYVPVVQPNTTPFVNPYEPITYADKFATEAFAKR